LRILKEFRKNPCVQIPHKSPCTNFQSIDKFKNLIFIPKGFFSASGPIGPAASQPTWPFGPPGPTGLLLPPQAKIEQAPPPPDGHAPPHGRLRPPLLKEKVTAFPPLHFPH
jgi:hypothetical protein